MVFSTPLFLLLFLPLFLLVYYLVPNSRRMVVILLGSWLFYALWRVDFLLLLILVSLWNYGAGEYIYRNRLHAHRARRGVVLAVTVNLLVLGYFKYAAFGLESLNALFLQLGLEPWESARIILPVGISFYIFQAMSYAVDIYRGDAEPADNFITLAAYLALFPQLIAGPILRYKDLEIQLKERRHSTVLFGQGFVFFMAGFCKKVLLADSVAPLADLFFREGTPSFTDAWFGVTAYAVQLYFDFAGYSQMAVGLGMMLGFFFRQNFNAPYKSLSITEFWRRWHISLSSWLRDYLYISLGGNRKGEGRTYFNLFIVMVLGGLWHGASWTFLLWGAWHGLWLMVERKWPALQGDRKKFSPLLWLRTMILVLVGWAFFKAESWSQMTSMIRGMAGLNGFSFTPELPLNRLSFAFLVLSVVVIICETKHPNDKALNHIRPAGITKALMLSCFFLLALFKMVAHSYSPFLYFRF
ncbi:MAG: membrane-bound O-acyltransferase family protein [Spirochaetales bacterium]|nr:membrane-bound O-acyltransferase family protein [Spirochaetales bacterium]